MDPRRKSQQRPGSRTNLAAGSGPRDPRLPRTSQQSTQPSGKFYTQFFGGEFKNSVVRLLI